MALKGVRHVAVALAVLFGAGCGGGGEEQEVIDAAGGGGEDADSDVVEVSIEGFSFVPEEVTVDVGQTVRWTNADNINHTVTSTDGDGNYTMDPLDSPLLGNGQTFEHTFTEAGDLPYRCQPHPQMFGRVVVE